jgi:hypothetical protein
MHIEQLHIDVTAGATKKCAKQGILQKHSPLLELTNRILADVAPGIF